MIKQVRGRMSYTFAICTIVTGVEHSRNSLILDPKKSENYILYIYGLDVPNILKSTCGG